MTTATIPSGNTVYTHPVAKVMISMPDDLLDRLDAQARANRETRSGFLRRLAERELEGALAGERDEIEALLAKALVPEGLGGDAARLIREDRESH
jgi:HicB-like antitoxin of HicAB toxin-antitoxin system